MNVEKHKVEAVIWVISIILLGIMIKFGLALSGVEAYHSPIFSGNSRAWDIFTNDPYEKYPLLAVFIPLTLMFIFRKKVREYYAEEEGKLFSFGWFLIRTFYLLILGLSLFVAIKFCFFILYILAAIFFEMPPGPYS